MRSYRNGMREEIEANWRKISKKFSAVSSWKWEYVLWGRQRASEPRNCVQTLTAIASLCFLSNICFYEEGRAHLTFMLLALRRNAKMWDESDTHSALAEHRSSTMHSLLTLKTPFDHFNFNRMRNFRIVECSLLLRRCSIFVRAVQTAYLLLRRSIESGIFECIVIMPPSKTDRENEKLFSSLFSFSSCVSRDEFRRNSNVRNEEVNASS